MIAVIVAPEQLYTPPAENVDMVEVMMPQFTQPWGCAPLNSSHGSSAGFVDDNVYNYNTWSGSAQDSWATEDWISTPQSNGSQALGSPQMPWMPVQHHIAPAPAPSPKSPDWHHKQIQASVADDQDAPPIGMRMQLQALQAKDPGSVLIARKLHRLGFNSAQKLQDHFCRYGGVREVLVPHSRVKASPGRRARTRPAAIGFVVMQSLEAAEAVLEEGNEHMIEGIQINVQAFERRTAEGSQDGFYGESPTSNSEESSDQEAKFYLDQDEQVSVTTTSPKTRWADISDEEDEMFIEQQLPKNRCIFSATLGQESPQNNGGRWADLYGDESSNINAPYSTDQASKVREYPEQYNSYNNQRYYQNNQFQRRQNGRGRANRGRA